MGEHDCDSLEEFYEEDGVMRLATLRFVATEKTEVT